MPYRPGTWDRSGELLGAGISSAGQSLGGALGTIGSMRREDQQRELKAAEEIDEYRGGIAYLAETGAPEITPDFLEKFESASLGQKRGMFAQVSASIARRMRDEQMEQTFGRNVALRELSHRLSLARSSMADDRAVRRAQEAAEDMNEMARILAGQGELTREQATLVGQMDDPRMQQALIDRFATRNRNALNQSLDLAAREAARRGGPKAMQVIPGPGGQPSGWLYDPNSGRTIEGPDASLFGTQQGGGEFLDEMGYGNP